MSKEAIYKEVGRLIKKWGDPNAGATDEELQDLERTLELAIDDVRQTLRNRKEETQADAVLTKLDEWKELNTAKQYADDHTRCPHCSDQLYFCDCTGEMADNLLLNHFDYLRTKVESDL